MVGHLVLPVLQHFMLAAAAAAVVIIRVHLVAPAVQAVAVRVELMRLQQTLALLIQVVVVAEAPIQ